MCLFWKLLCVYAAEWINNSAGSNYVWSGQDGNISTSDEFIISTPGEYHLSQNGCETLNQNFIVGGEVVSGCTNSSAVNYNEIIPMGLVSSRGVQTSKPLIIMNKQLKMTVLVWQLLMVVWMS